MEYTKLTSITWGLGLLQALNKMRIQKEMCDLKITLENNVMMHAHCCVLSAASPFLKSLLSEAENPELNMESFPGDIVRQIIDFVYTGTALIKKSDQFVFHSVAATLNITALTDMAQKINQTHVNKGHGGDTNSPNSQSKVFIVSPQTTLKPSFLHTPDIKEAPPDDKLDAAVEFLPSTSAIPKSELELFLEQTATPEQPEHITPKRKSLRVLSLSAKNPTETPRIRFVSKVPKEEDMSEPVSPSGGEIPQITDVLSQCKSLTPDGSAELDDGEEDDVSDDYGETDEPEDDGEDFEHMRHDDVDKEGEDFEGNVMQAVEVTPQEMEGVVPQELLQPIEADDSNQQDNPEPTAEIEHTPGVTADPKPIQVIQHSGDDYVIGTLYPVVPEGEETDNAVSSIGGATASAAPSRKRKRTGAALNQAPTHNGVTFMCEFCSRCFTDQIYYERHREKHISLSGNQDRRFKCSYCAYSSNYNHVLKEHERTHTGERPHKCQHCDKTFSHIKNYREHERSHGENPKYACTKCEKEFNWLPNLRKHMLVVHEPDYRPHKCPLCSRCFKLVECLKRHMETHSKTCPYHCDPCGKQFWARQSYIKHMRNIHEGKQSSHICATCGKIYKTKLSFQKHNCWNPANKTQTKFQRKQPSRNVILDETDTVQEIVSEPKVMIVDSRVKEEGFSDGETSSEAESVLSDGEFPDEDIPVNEELVTIAPDDIK